MTRVTDPLDKATSTAPPTLGEGCLSRYDPDALSPDDGTEFEGAAQLWQDLQKNSDEADEQS
ncbi:hypothetical protein CFII64_22220 [Pseudomonas sp. CFII64]|jgi:hypothetical protein|nr:hypothetical protein CFII64_22220 [Pseudomonas sp. CFII64]